MISLRGWDVRSCRFIGLVLVAMSALAASWLAVSSASALATPTVSCSLYAAPSGSDSSGDGSQGNPFQTAQHLVSVLAAGQTGCLMSGTYDSSPGLSFEKSGSAGAPITLASAPGQTATLAGGYVYMPTGSNYVTLEDLSINGAQTTQVSVQIFGSHDSLIGDNITNDEQHNSCIIMGFPGYSPVPTATLITDNVIHQCGSTADGNQNHAIYFSQSQDATVTDNVIWGTAAFAIHLYADADGNTIEHNVIDDNGYGVIFGSADDGGSGSNDNTVAYNVITNSSVGMGAQQSWGGAVGTGNTFAHNCLDSNANGNVETPYGFNSSANVTAAPGYADAAAHSYSLSSSSPCLAVVGYAGLSTTTTTTTAPETAATASRAKTKRRTARATHRRRHARRA